MTAKTKALILKSTAVGIDVIAPLVATIAQFPVWVEKSAGATVSGLFIVMAFLCCIPFYRAIFSWLKSPSAPLMWTVIFVLMYALSRIIDQMLTVCLVGIISNCIGAVIYKIGKKVEESDE